MVSAPGLAALPLSVKTPPLTLREPVVSTSNVVAAGMLKPFGALAPPETSQVPVLRCQTPPI
jgi:hypothetical protein